MMSHGYLRAFQRGPIPTCCEDGVLFGMDGKSQFCLPVQHSLDGVIRPSGKSVVSQTDDAAVCPKDNCPNLGAGVFGPSRDMAGEV